MPATGEALAGPVAVPTASRVGPSSRVSAELSSAPLLLGAFVRSLARTPIRTLEQTSRRLTPALAAKLARRVPDLLELGVLRTCHRVEVYAVARSAEALASLGSALPKGGSGWELLSGGEVSQHLFRVSAGLESIAPGEREVRDQVLRASHQIFTRSTRSDLRTLFQEAHRFAMAALPNVSGAPSIARVAAELIDARAKAERPRTVVLGTGTIGRQLAELLGRRTALTLVYHRQAPEKGWLRRMDARAYPWKEIPSALSQAEVLVAAAKGGDPLVLPARLPRAPRGHRLLVIDLGMPRNIDPAVGLRKGVELWDLERIRSELPREAPSSQLEEEAKHAGAAAFKQFSRKAMEPLLSEIWRTAERLRLEELEGAISRLPGLEAGERAVVAKMTERLVRRLLAGPTRKLRELPGEDRDDLLRLAVTLFGDV